jgi:hypothetical protein
MSAGWFWSVDGDFETSLPGDQPVNKNRRIVFEFKDKSFDRNYLRA